MGCWRTFEININNNASSTGGSINTGGIYATSCWSSLILQSCLLNMRYHKFILKMCIFIPNLMLTVCLKPVLSHFPRCCINYSFIRWLFVFGNLKVFCFFVFFFVLFLLEVACFIFYWTVKNEPRSGTMWAQVYSNQEVVCCSSSMSCLLKKQQVSVSFWASW